LCCVRWYSYRWLIERFHFALKSGCNIEQLQLESADRIMRALGFNRLNYANVTNDTK